MKKIFSLFLVALAATTLTHAQTAVTEGSVVYSMDTEGSTDATITAMMSGTSTVSFKDVKSCIEMQTAMMNMKSVMVATTGKGTTLVNAGPSKYFIQMGKQDIMKKQNQNGKYTISYPGETKTIIGHVCNKAVITFENGTKAIYWLTNDVMPQSPYAKEFIELSGFPLEYEMPAGNGMTLHFIATELKTAGIPDSLFVVDTTGYTEMSYDQLAKMSGH